MQRMHDTLLEMGPRWVRAGSEMGPYSQLYECAVHASLLKMMASVMAATAFSDRTALMRRTSPLESSMTPASPLAWGRGVGVWGTMSRALTPLRFSFGARRRAFVEDAVRHTRHGRDSEPSRQPAQRAENGQKKSTEDRQRARRRRDDNL